MYRLSGVHLVVLFGLAVACSDTPTEPLRHPLSGKPWFDNSTYYYPTWCRMWAFTGLVSHNHGGQFDANGCFVSVAATPSLFMGTVNPGPITYEFSTPIIELKGGVSITRTPCSTAPMTYQIFAPDGTLKDSGSLDWFPAWGSQCPGGDVTNAAFATSYHGPIKRCVITPPSPLPADFEPGHAVSIQLEFNMPCPTTTDTVLNNNASVRQGLGTQWNLAKSENLERAGWIYRDDATGEYSVVADLVHRRDRCGVDLPKVPPTLAGKTAIEAWHTHIIDPGQPLLPNCLNADPGQRALNGPYGFLTGTDRDIEWIRGSGYRHLVIDSDEIFAFFADGLWQSYDWRDNCRWAGA